MNYWICYSRKDYLCDAEIETKIIMNVHPIVFVHDLAKKDRWAEYRLLNYKELSPAEISMIKEQTK